MENQDNIAGLGKNHDKEAQANDQDIPKKQSQAKPGAENLDMMPNSVNKSGDQEFSQKGDLSDNVALHHKAAAYAKEEHEKAKGWEDNPENI